MAPKTLFRAGNDVWEPALPETAQKRSFEPERDRDERHGLSFRGVRSANYDAQLRIWESRDSPVRNCAPEVWC